MEWRVYLKDNRTMGAELIEADTLVYDKRVKSWVFRRFRYDDEEIVAVFPREGINGILKA